MDIDTVIRRIGDFTSDAILITEAEPFVPPGPRILWCNKAFTEMTGYTLDDVRGQTPRMLQGEDTDPETRRTIAEGLSKWRNVRAELKNYTKAGEPFWVDLSIQPVADDKGWYHYWVAIQRDVTVRKLEQMMVAEKLEVLSRAQERLKRERAEIAGVAAIAENAQDLITVTDTEFRILWANRSFLEHSEYTLEDVIGRTHCHLLGKQSDAYPSREVAMKAAMNGSFEAGWTQNFSLTGRSYWTDTGITAERDYQGRIARFIIVERDITEQRALQEELRAHRDNLRQLVEERTAIVCRQAEELAVALAAQKALNEQQIQFVRMASHEFRTPMSVISMAARRARKAHATGDAEDHGRRMEAIETSLARLGKLIDSTLELAKADAGKLDCKLGDVQFGGWLALKVDEWADTSATHAIRFHAENLDGVVVEADHAMLEHVFDNLVGNAVKYSPKAAAIDIVLRREGDLIRVDVRDYGVGVPQSEIPKLFKRYFRASTASGIAGTGIGLSVVKEFVELHHGRLEVASAAGAGACFTVFLPIKGARAVEAVA